MSDQSDIKVSIVGDSTNVEETFAKVERGAEKMAQSTVRSGEKASKSTEGIGKGADNAARAYGRFEAEIRRRTAAVQAALEGTGRAGEIANKAIAQGLDVSKLEPGLKTLRELEAALGTGGKQLDQYGLSAKQTAAALRGVPAQMTDIIVSLQGGQAPMTVLLQQGGQLKDMFGGIVPAAKALSSAALGLVNPFTVAAGAAAGLYMAYRAGASESEAFEKTLITTGNRAGVTASQLATMAQSMDAVYGTQRNASQALNQFAGAAGIASKNFQEFALAAVKWEDATGTAVSETVKQFEALGKAPVEASVKLNESMNYLTASVYEQIKAFEQSGKTTAAADLAQRTFADAINDRSPKIVEQVGLIEQAWRAVKKVISEVADEAAKTGRDTLADQIAYLDRQIKTIEERNKFSPYTLSDPAAAIKQQRAALQARMELENSAAELGKFISDSNRASIEESDFREKYIKERLSIAEQRSAAIEEEQAKFQKAITNLVAGSKEYERAYAAHKNRLLEIDKRFAEKKQPGGIRATDTELARLRASIQAEELRAQALLASGSAYASLNEYEVKAIEYGEKLKLTTDAKTKAKLQELKAESERAGAAKRANDELDRQLKSQAQTTDSVRKQNQSLKDQIETYGMGKSAIEEMIIARLEERLAIEESKPGNDAVVAGIREEIAARRELMGNMRTKEALDLQLKEWEQWEKDVGQIFQQVSQSLTDAIFEGGKSGRDLLKDLFKTLTLRVLINPVMNSIQGAVTNSLGGMFGFNNPQQQAGGANVLGMAQNAQSMYSAYSGGLSSTLGQGASWLGKQIGSEALSSFGLGLTGSAGAAGTVAGIASIGTGLGASLGASIGTSAASMATTTFSASLAGTSAAATAGTVGSTVGAGAAGAGMSLGAAIPYVGLAIGAASLLSGLFGDDEPKTRHGQWEWAEMSGGDWGMKYRDSRQPAGTGDAITQYARSAVDSANSMFGKLGVNAAIEHFYATTNSSVLGDRNGVASGGTIRAGDSVSTFGLMGLGGDRTKYGYGGWSKEEMLPRLQTDIQLSILQAFQTQVDSLPGLLADMIRGVNIRGLDAAGAQALAEQFNAIIQGVDQFRTAVESLPFENLKNLSFDAAANLIQFAGGLENLNAGLGAYYENFYSEAEQQQKVWADIGKVLEGVGLTVPKTRDSFRALVEAQDLTTEAGQRAYAALLGVSGAFAQVATASEQAAEAARQAAAAAAQQRLALQDRISELSGVDMTNELRRRELAAMDQSNRSLQEQIYHLEDQAKAAQAAAEAHQRAVEAYQQAQANTSAAWATVQEVARRDIERLQQTFTQTDSVYRALTKSIDAQRTALSEQMRASEQMVSSLRAIVDLVRGSVRDLRGQVDSTAQVQYEQALAVIRQAAGGTVPDRDRLAEAITAARGVAEDSGRYASAFDREFAMLSLANELERVQLNAEPQLSVQEQALEVAKQQLAKLDETLSEAKRQIDFLRGIDDGLYEQVLETVKLQLANEGQLDKLVGIDENTFVTEKLLGELLKAQSGEGAARAQIDGINAQLALAQRQLDALNGINSTGLTMIQALNNLAAAMDAQRVATPPPTSGGTAPTIPGTSPAVTVPDVIWNSNHEFTREQALGKRAYKPITTAEWVDYIDQNLDLKNAFAQAVAAGGGIYPQNNPMHKAYWAQDHWAKFGYGEGRRYAKGGYYPGGMALVGEEGPELINFRAPGQVYTAGQTQDILRSISAGDGGGGVSRELIAEIRALRAENKAHAQSIASLQAQNLRILRQWDGTGMPEQRELVDAA